MVFNAEVDTFKNVFQHLQTQEKVDEFEMKGKWNELYFKNNNPIVLVQVLVLHQKQDLHYYSHRQQVYTIQALTILDFNLASLTNLTKYKSLITGFT
jgi:hypothetical protein